MALLRPAEAAKLLGVSTKQLTRLKLPYVNVGASQRVKRRYDEAVIMQFLEDRRCEFVPGRAEAIGGRSSTIEIIDFTVPRKSSLRR
jgi:hypothetical protein